MKKFFKNIVCISFICFYSLNTNKAQSIIPYYHFPNKKNLEEQSLTIGRNAYQLLYFGQYKESLNLAKLALKINTNNEKLWLILSEAQVANEQYKNALDSLNKAEKIDSKNSEIFFAKSSIYFKISELDNAKNALELGLEIDPNNHKAIFQLGNILLIQKKLFRSH